MKKALSFSIRTLLLLCLAFTISCDNDDDKSHGKTEAKKQQKLIVSVLKAHTEVSVFTAAFEGLDLSNNTAANFTVFTIKNKSLGLEKLTPVIPPSALDRHVIEGALDLKTLKSKSEITSLGGEKLEVNVMDGGVILINGIEIDSLTKAGDNIIFIASDIIPAEPPAKTIIRKKIEIAEMINPDNSKLVFTFDYSNADKINSHKIFNINPAGDTISTDFYEYNFKYSDDDKLTNLKITGTNLNNEPQSREYNFTYKQNIVYVQDVKDSSYSHSFSVDQSARKILQDNQTTYEYDIDGNLVKKQSSSESDAVVTYTYDNQKAVFSHQAIPTWVWLKFHPYASTFTNYIFTNNAITEKHVYNDNSKPNIEIKYIYEYDNLGYPTRMSWTEGGQTRTIQFTSFTIIYCG